MCLEWEIVTVLLAGVGGFAVRQTLALRAADERLVAELERARDAALARVQVLEDRAP